MDLRRRLVITFALALAALAITAAPSSAIVGGSDAAPGEYPSVAEITFGAFGCTGTLISPDTVLTAGHCGSLTGAAVASPAAYPPQLVNVRIGSNKAGQGEQRAGEQRHRQPRLPAHRRQRRDGAQALAQRHSDADQGRRRGRARAWAAGTAGHDRGLGRHLRRAATPRTRSRRRRSRSPPTPTAARPTTTSTPPRWCAPATRRAAWTPARATPAARCSPAAGVVGATSFGEGCARPGKPGVYARVADAPLREWIRGRDADGVN